MSVDFACSCGKRFRVEDHHAGKKTKCPVCGVTLEIPAIGISSLLDEELFSIAPPAPAPSVPPKPESQDLCPRCGQPVGAGEVTCGSCGYGLFSGKSVEEERPEPKGEGVEAFLIGLIVIPLSALVFFLVLTYFFNWQVGAFVCGLELGLIVAACFVRVACVICQEPAPDMETAMLAHLYINGLLILISPLLFLGPFWIVGNLIAATLVYAFLFDMGYVKAFLVVIVNGIMAGVATAAVVFLIVLVAMLVLVLLGHELGQKELVLNGIAHKVSGFLS